MSKPDIKIGVMALTDSAPFVVAQRLNLFHREGLSVQLCWQASWATLRDKLVYGEIDAAHMLSPMAIALQLGLGGSPRREVLAPVVLSQGGNAITVGRRLQNLMGTVTEGESLGSALRKATENGGQPFVFGTVFPYSMHTLQLRRWLLEHDIEPSQDIRIEAVPPARMVDCLRDGRLDAFCVGEPYNSLAVNSALGEIVATSADLWPGAPEKVLGCMKVWADQNPEGIAGLKAALRTACAWLGDGEENCDQAASWLSDSDCINLPPSLIKTALSLSPSGVNAPHVHFVGSPATPEQRAVYVSLVEETHGMIASHALEATGLNLGLLPFGL